VDYDGVVRVGPFDRAKAYELSLGFSTARLSGSTTTTIDTTNSPSARCYPGLLSGRMHSTVRMVVFCQPFVCTWTCRKNLPLICVSSPIRRMTFDLDLKPFEAQSRRARQLLVRHSPSRSP
jgi:hypothetical protein